MPSYDKAAYAEQMKARTKELTDKLETGMKELYDGDKYKAYLNSMSKFHNYSTKNIMLIHQQMPDASRIASFKTWKETLNRSVKKDEKGLYIYAPAKQKEPEKVMMEKLDLETGAPLLDKNGKVIMEEMTPLSALDRIKFVLVPVFDVSQTVGEPLPELIENITGNVVHYEAFIDALKDVSPLPIVFEPMKESQDGYCTYGEKIGIREGMSETQTVSAIIHEMTHDRLHDKNKLPENAKPKKESTKEIEAESTSYVVCKHYDIETSPNSFGYLAKYGSRDMSEIKASLDIIRKEAGSLITAIDERFNAICQERGIDLMAKAPEQAAEPSYTTESRTENIAGVDFQFQEVTPEAAKTRETVEEKNHDKFVEMFPQVASGEYSYLRLESTGFEPLSVEWIGDNRISVMHTYTQEGDLMYDPMMTFEVDREARKMTAVEYEMSMPPLYQVVDEDGRGRSIDGNGREQTLQNLQMSLNGFASQWLENIDEQGYIPVWAIMEINGEDTQITFDKDEKPILPELENGNLQPPADKEISNELDILMPDPSIDLSEMNLYGYTADDMLPLTTERAIELFNQDLTVYMLYDDNTEAMVFDTDEIITFGSDGIFGITRADWENSQEYMNLSAQKGEPVKESKISVLAQDIDNFLHDSFSFYQLKDVAETRYHRFASIKQLEADNLSVDRSNYELAYTAPLPSKETLEGLFEKFNLDPPKDYVGRSMSVSDVIVIERGGETSAHYVDNYGFAEIPEFLTVQNEQTQSVPAAVGGDTDFKKLPEQPEPQKNEIPVYKFTGETARDNGELDAYRQSYKLNVECGHAIDQAVKDNNYELYRYDLKKAIKSVIDEYGADRTAWVLAGNVNSHEWDGRLSNSTKEWAKGFETAKPDVYLQSHMTIVDSLVTRFREAEKEKPSLLNALNKTEQRIKQQSKTPDTVVDNKEKPKKSNREDI